MLCWGAAGPKPAPYFAIFSLADADFGPAAPQSTVEARDGGAPMPLAMYQNEKGIAAAVVEVARPEGRIFQLFRCAVIQCQQNGWRRARGSSRTRGRLPLILAGVGQMDVFGGVADGGWARVIVGREIK